MQRSSILPKSNYPPAGACESSSDRSIRCQKWPPAACLKHRSRGSTLYPATRVTPRQRLSVLQRLHTYHRSFPFPIPSQRSCHISRTDPRNRRSHLITPITSLTPVSPAPSPPRRIRSPPPATLRGTVAAAAHQTCSITPTTSANGRLPPTGPEPATTKRSPTAASTTPTPSPLQSSALNPPNQPSSLQRSMKKPKAPKTAPTLTNIALRSKTPPSSAPKPPRTRQRAGSFSSAAPRMKR